MFHELRNHLNVQKSTLDMVAEHHVAAQGEPISAELASFVGEAQAHAQHATLLISNMLDFTKAHAGMLVVPQVSFQLHAMLREANVTATAVVDHRDALERALLLLAPQVVAVSVVSSHLISSQLISTHLN